MKRIFYTLLLMFILFITSQTVYSQDEVVLTFDENFKQLILNTEESIQSEKLVINEVEAPVVNTSPTDFSSPAKEYNNILGGVNQSFKDLYKLKIDNTDKLSFLFENKLTKHFESTPVESIHAWIGYQSNFQTIMDEDEKGYTKYTPSIINIIFDGKTRENQDDFRIMFDVAPQHNYPFINYFLKDFYYQFNRVPHHKILVGNSRTGVTYEGAMSPYLLPFYNRSQIARTYGNSRKYGLRIKGDYKYVDYDIGGYSSDTFYHEFMPGVELDAWVSFKPLAKVDEKYGKLLTGGGISSGRRNSHDYLIGSSFIGYEYKKFWTRMEYSIADGYNGAGGLSDLKTEGWYVTLGYKLTKKIELLARYDEFNPDRNISHNNKKEYSAGINYFIKGQAIKLILNYVFCQNQALANSHRIIIGTQLLI